MQAEGNLAGALRALEVASLLLAQGAPGPVRPELIACQVALALES